MDAHTLSRRNRPGRSGPRRALALAAVAATAMLAAACGGTNPPGAAGSTRYQKALAFSKCMRSHGALAFPDPSNQGTFTVTQALMNNAQIKSAAPSCQKLLPRGAVQIPAALERKLETQALRYAACMRSHGMPSFPDPTIHDGAIGFHVAVRSSASGPQSSAGTPAPKPSGGSGPKPSGGAPAMPAQFQAAQRACQNLQPGGR